MDTLNKGTKEVLVISVADRLNAITDLGAYNVEQKVTTEDEQTKQDWTTVLETDVMEVHSLVDTTGWAEGIYNLYVRINVAPELPILGPFKFGVS